MYKEMGNHNTNDAVDCIFLIYGLIRFLDLEKGPQVVWRNLVLRFEVLQPLNMVLWSEPQDEEYNPLYVQADIWSFPAL